MSDTQTVVRIPIDFDALEKGSYIEPSTLERLFGISRTEKQYSLKMMSLIEEAESRLSDRGIEAVIVQHKEGLRVLTDSEAAEHTNHAFAAYGRRMKRMLGKQQAVDVSRLTEEQKADHERAMIVNGRVYQAMAKTRREAIRLVAHERTTPLIGVTG